MNVTKQPCSTYNKDVKCCDSKAFMVFCEFKQLYEEKMRIIDSEGGGDFSVHAKLNLQKDWIRDLSEQNEMLIKAVEDIEQEATERVLSLEAKLNHSSKCAAEEVSEIQQRLSKEIADKLEVILELRREVKNLEEQCDQAAKQTYLKDNIIRELKKEIKQLKQEFRREKEIDVENARKCRENEINNLKEIINAKDKMINEASNRIEELENAADHLIPSNELEHYNERKRQQNDIVNDLTQQVNDCQEDLKNLHSVLIQEQVAAFIDNKSLENTIKTMQLDLMEAHGKFLMCMKCLENDSERHENYVQTVYDKNCEILKLLKELENLNHQLSYNNEEVKLHKDRINVLEHLLSDYEKSLQVLNEESAKCEQDLKEYLLVYNKMREEYAMKCTELKAVSEKFDKHENEHYIELAQLYATIATLKTETLNNEEQCCCLRAENKHLHRKLLELSGNEDKIRVDASALEAEYNNKLKESEAEMHHLTNIIVNLETRLNDVSSKIVQQHNEIINLKGSHKKSQKIRTNEKIQHQKEISDLTNQINWLIRDKAKLEEKIAALEDQLEKLRNIEKKGDEKAQVLDKQLNQCLLELYDLQAERELLARKNEQLENDIKKIQHAHLEIELTETNTEQNIVYGKNINVINNVRAWLNEQRTINIELNKKNNEKNAIINKLAQEKMVLETKMKNLTKKEWDLKSTSSVYYTYLPQQNLSLRSVGSTSRSWSVTSNSEWESTENNTTPHVWLHRIECIKEQMHRKYNNIKH